MPGCLSLPSPAGEAREPLPASPQIQALENEVAARVNSYRRSQGLAVLASDEYLSQAARAHSVEMASGRRAFGHGGFNARADRIREKLDVRSVSENVAYNNYPIEAAPARVVDGWVRSPGHRANLAGAHDRAGTGAARNEQGTWYVTQIYADVR